MNKYRAAVIANAFITRGANSGYPLDHLQIQKLLYFTHYWGLILYDRSPLQEPVEAWKHGPVVSSLFYRLSKHRDKHVLNCLECFSPSMGCDQVLTPCTTDIKFWQLFNNIWKTYGHWSGLQLSCQAHKLGDAWDVTRQKLELYISDEDIRQDYELNYNSRKAKA